MSTPGTSPYRALPVLRHIHLVPVPLSESLSLTETAVFPGPHLEDQVHFLVPRVFQHRDPSCSGDVFLRSSDDSLFCVVGAIIAQASPRFRRLLSLELETLDGLQLLHLPTNAEALLALLQAIYPGSAAPISTASLASSCAEAAFKYHISLEVLRHDPNLFSEFHLRQDPFTLLVLAWGSGEWCLVEKASRFTHKLDLIGLLAAAEAMTHMGGQTALSALTATRLRRNSKILEVAGHLPGDLLCPACRARGRNSIQAIVDAVADVFNAPYPNTNFILTAPSSLATSALLADCPSRTCDASIQNYKYTTRQIEVIRDAALAVPQTIIPDFIEAEVSRRSNERALAWGILN